MTTNGSAAGLAATILEQWFGAPDSAEFNTERAQWFRRDAAFDAALRERFLPAWEDALAHPDGWGTGEDAPPDVACARIVLLDQFPRNMFRGDPRSFATDAQALSLAERMVARGDDLRLPTPYHRMFCYMPFEHAESLAAQQLAVERMTALRDDTQGRVDVVEWAVRHQVVIARFGRFPHRNAVLGRPSTPEELAFLQQPGSSF
ncbi:DUF924 family protein [Cupriavidus sp. AU9028]|uniref:DUF924 family protein n=1 Tax=Cupriavidus sp. AU9028 TaxID=2871157 RepID=UPI001C98AFB1|nr:DUF924 family protein [Cupriavidus sp. AU9028]MBY4895727.1 DUF924 domain-containing protein [Cupriavidus sp. AU9028]